jgi:hypothetical protein
MRILFLGNFEAEFSSENYYKKTFEKLGHEVFPAQEGMVNTETLKQWIALYDIEMFFWVHTHGWFTSGIESVLSECRSRNIPSVAYHLDLYLGIQREHELKTDPFFTVDHFFTVDKLMADWLNSSGHDSANGAAYAMGHFLPAGVFEDDCFLGTPNHEKYPHEIIFTGSKGYHPEWPYRPRLINWLHENYGSRFGHYGGGGLPSVRGRELNNLYASAKIVIGDTLCKNFDYPWYSSDRLFEVCGRGGFMIYPYITGLDEFYNGDELKTYHFKDFDQLQGIISFFLSSDDLRNEMKLKAFNRTKSEHTYTHRLKTILQTIGK